MTLRASGDLVYWNAHTGFGEIDLDDGCGRIGIYRVDPLRAGVRKSQIGDRFHLNTGVATNGATTAIPYITNPYNKTQVTPLVDDINYNVWDAKRIATYQEIYGQAAPSLNQALHAECSRQFVIRLMTKRGKGTVFS